MRIHDLYGRHPRETVYVIGTGPSLRCVPLDFFKDKICIGLNQAWRHLPTTYSITVHPELLQECEKKEPNRTRWVVKKKPPMGDLALDDPRYHVFHTSYDVLTIAARPADTLYLGEGVQTTAMDLAARMGAAFVVLVGCDAGTLGAEFHAHDQHVRWLGMRPADQFRLYRDTTALARTALRHLGVGVMSLSPFIGATAAEEDYARLTAELKLPRLPKPKDVSPYRRDPSTIRGPKPVKPAKPAAKPPVPPKPRKPR